MWDRTDQWDIQWFEKDVNYIHKHQKGNCQSGALPVNNVMVIWVLRLENKYFTEFLFKYLGIHQLI